MFQDPVPEKTYNKSPSITWGGGGGGGGGANDPDTAQLHVKIIIENFKRRKSIQRFLRLKFFDQGYAHGGGTKGQMTDAAQLQILLNFMEKKNVQQFLSKRFSPMDTHIGSKWANERDDAPLHF